MNVDVDLIWIVIAAVIGSIGPILSGLAAWHSRAANKAVNQDKGSNEPKLKDRVRRIEERVESVCIEQKLQRGLLTSLIHRKEDHAESD